MEWDLNVSHKHLTIPLLGAWLEIISEKEMGVLDFLGPQLCPVIITAYCYYICHPNIQLQLCELSECSIHTSFVNHTLHTAKKKLNFAAMSYYPSCILFL